MSRISFFRNLGSVIGKEIYNNSFASKIGRVTGSWLAQKLNAELTERKFRLLTEEPKLEKINLQTSRYGKEIPIIYGIVKLSGNIIWADGVRVIKESLVKEYGKFHKSEKILSRRTISIAIALCEGIVDKLNKMWIDNVLVDISEYDMKFYSGTEYQEPDPTIISIKGKDATPAYRGLSYVVIKNFELKANGKIPNFSFEIERSSLSKGENRLENMISAVCMIPGTGEFAYDTIVQKKIEVEKAGYDKINPVKHQEITINSHNPQNEANAILSLDNLKKTLPNVQWISPVICWFITDLNIADSDILPGVEVRDIKTDPDIWRVANFDRQSAHLITQKNNSPIYGGTVSDNSFKRYIVELKSRGYKIMLHPMIMVDKLGKPWRGEISPKTEQEIDYFFEKYQKFIEHYAVLLNGYIDAFLIGSELVNITNFKTQNNDFPSVKKLVEISKTVKNILGKNVKVSYGANWGGEYHHTKDGWYHMDTLWGSDSIDFVGINAYFPLTNVNETPGDYDYIAGGFKSGEYFDYFFQDGEKITLKPEYAEKNIKWWWENYHRNPNGEQSLWKPKMKKIWFTEFGFASLDCSTNEPNVFVDSSTEGSRLPKYSKGKIDFSSQRNGLLAVENFWKYSEIVENKFIWAWDVRPYPYWPYRDDIWNDAENWATGHWLQGKIGSVLLSDICKEICLKAGIKEHFLDININEEITGFYIVKHTTAYEIIDVLKKLYCFDLFEIGNSIVLKQSNKNTERVQINENELISVNDTFPINIVKASHESMQQSISIQYIKHEYAFLSTNISTTNSDAVIKKKIVVPIVLKEIEAKRLINRILYKSIYDTVKYDFHLPMAYMFIRLGDVIEINCLDRKHIIKVEHVDIINNLYLKIEGVAN